MSESKNKKRKFSLKNLKIEEISGVDMGANPGAKVLFFKREHKETDTMKIEELAKSLEDQAKQIETMKAENETLKALSEMSDEHRSFQKTLSGDEAESFVKADTEARDALIEKANSDDGKTDIEKAISTATGPLQKALDAAQSKIDKMEADKAESDCVAKFDKRLPSYSGTADEKSEFMKSMQGLGDDAQEAVFKQLEKADEITRKMMGENGTALRSSDDPVEKLNQLAKAHAKENDVTFEKAYMSVLKSAEGSELYNQSQN